MGSGTGSPKSNSNNEAVAVSRHILPSDLPTAIKHLDNQELNELFDAVVAERLRRGMKSPVPEKTPSHRTVDAAAVSLNLGKVNAVRAAFNAGVTPSKIAKEFGISQADVRKVIASEGLKR
jgi:type II secretory pathway component PulC